MTDDKSSSVGRYVPLIVVLAGLGASWSWLAQSGTLDAWLVGDGPRRIIESIGSWGPLVIVGLMTAAIVVSPIPSAPVALAAGAVYGHGWGTVYVVMGAELGALIAFGLARFAGRDLVSRWLGRNIDLSGFATQNTLMAVVFVSRLLPFLSFDLFSYAAGLTPLKAWRFALATLAGIIPASFLLAHFGDALASGEAARIVWALGVLGGLGLVSMIWRSWNQRRSGAAQD